MSRVLVTEMSGTGKSAALAELGRRGYGVVETDEPGWSEYHEYGDPTDELHRGEWLWVEERITELLAAADDDRSLFVEGCVRNQSKFSTVSMRSSSSVPLPTWSLTGSRAERRTTTGRLQ